MLFVLFFLDVFPRHHSNHDLLMVNMFHLANGGPQTFLLPIYVGFSLLIFECCKGSLEVSL